jgi:bacteriocin-like protein
MNEKFEVLNSKQLQSIKGGDSGDVETDYIGAGSVSPNGSVSVEQE